MSKNSRVVMIGLSICFAWASTTCAQDQTKSILDSQQYKQSQARFVESDAEFNASSGTTASLPPINPIRQVALHDERTISIRDNQALVEVILNSDNPISAILEPGDLVNVVAVFDQQGYGPKTAKTFLKDIKVFNRDQSRATLIVNKKQKEKFLLTSNQAEIKIVLAGHQQDDTPQDDVISPQQTDVHELAYPDRKIQDISISFENIGKNRPEDLSVNLIDKNAGSGSWEPFANRTVCWPSPGISYRPLYFEDVRLERYGQVRYPLVQPWRGAVHYFGSVAALPVIMYQQPPNQCEYPLGHCRPGNIVPYTWDRWWIR